MFSRLGSYDSGATRQANNLWSALPLVESVVTQQPLGLMMDVDGTIVEIASAPWQARLPAKVRRLLTSLCKRSAVVAAISGRRAAEVEEIMRVKRMLYFGNHGLENRQDGFSKTELRGVQRIRESIVEAREGLQERLGKMPGVILEDKELAVAVHYRRSLEPDRIRDIAPEEAERLAIPMGLTVKTGKMVVEICPKQASKGWAVTRLIRRFNLCGAIYLGDDRTDIDAFQALNSLKKKRFRGLAVAVRSGESPEGLLNVADLYLDGVSEVVKFLQWLDRRLNESGSSDPLSGGGASV